MKKIIHMSDLHVGYRDFLERFFLLINHLKTVIPGRPSQYVLVITGDLINNANQKGSYRQVHKGLHYLKKAGFNQILVVPGNHDYGTGHKGNKKFVSLFKEAFFHKDIDYPKVDIITNIAFIGLDSMAEELNWYDSLWAQGQLGKKQLKALEAILNQKEIVACAKRVLYLHHHPFKWRPLHQLKDARKFKKVLVRAMDSGHSIDALLFGHNHQGHAHNGRWGVPRCYDAGTALLKPRPKYINKTSWFKVQSSIRIIDLSKAPDTDRILPTIFTENSPKKSQSRR